MMWLVKSPPSPMATKSSQISESPGKIDVSDVPVVAGKVDGWGRRLFKRNSKHSRIDRLAG
jgi:hypothetical protein